MLRTLLEIDADEDVVAWMAGHKTDAALRIAEAAVAITYPTYLTDAIEFFE